MAGILLAPWLIETIQKGDAVLFLGAGASYGAVGPKGEKPPSGDKLRDLLSDKFLGGALKKKPLAHVAEMAKSESSLTAVEEFVKDIFQPLQPAKFHSLVAGFRWFSIITTNFDLILERAYAAASNRQQELVPIIKDGDDFSHHLRDPLKVLYLKLHGSITHIGDDTLPLILASEEYAKHRRNRERLFKHFQDWGRERPIIFCGYDISDPNIQQILFDLGDQHQRRPQYATVNPGLDAISCRYWNGKRFITEVKSFEQFLIELDGAISPSLRGIATLVKERHLSIAPWVKARFAPSSSLLRYLSKELTHVRKGMPVVGVSPQGFYKGLSHEWGVFQQDLDVPRRLSDDVILEAFLDEAQATIFESYVVKGYAGAGKSIALRRIAWDIANKFDGLVFYLEEGGVLRREQIAELYSLVGQRVFVIFDDVIPYADDVIDISNWAEKTSTPLTLIFGARTNEWNVSCQELAQRVTAEYELRDLSITEIDELIRKLDAAKALGRLKAATVEERRAHFQLTAERQLLVALHDISGEKSFEEIVFDEYKNIQPTEARILYLDVCTLHRLGVGVRAGLISRVSGITFEYFSRDFFEPLEHVVRTYFDNASRDNMYRSRHALIAEIVFRSALIDQEERVAQLTRIIRNMDVDYASDDLAFRQMIRGRTLADLFQNKQLAASIFEAALESGAPRSFVEHQRAVFELHHKSGNLYTAMEAIERAIAAADHDDRAILHTKASILRQLALTASQPLIRDKYREEAKAILFKQIRGGKVSHSFSTAAAILIDELKDKVAEKPKEGAQDLQSRAIAEVIREIEEILYEGLQRFPDDEFLLVHEAELGKVLNDTVRASEALTRAFQASPGRAFIAVRLARFELARGDAGKAIEILKKCLAANGGSHEAHFQLARILMDQDERGLRDEISHHLRRSFTPADSNLDAQFWCARHHYLYGDRAMANSLFKQLASARVASDHRNRVRDVLRGPNNETRFAGVIASMKDSFCFVSCPEIGTELFAHSSEFKEREWKKAGKGDRVTYEVGFALRGPSARAVRIQG